MKCKYLFSLSKIKCGATVFFLFLAFFIVILRLPAHEKAPQQLSNTLESIEKQPGKAMLQGVKIDLNLATRAQLEWISGIGPKRASVILQKREKAFFASWSDLRRRVRLPKSVLDQLARYTVLPSHHEKQKTKSGHRHERRR